MDEATTRRLALIRYFYTVGVTQSRQKEPMSSVSIRSFHDSVELFLQLASEFLNVGSNRTEFMEYWELLSTKTTATVTQKESMRRLNKSRVALKHHGTLPSRLDIETFRASVTSFFAENTTLIFGVNFESISLIELVACEEARQTLQNAESVLGDGNYAECLVQCALAFEILVADYEQRMTTQFRRSPFYFGEPLETVFLDIDGPLDDFIEQVKDSVESMQSAIRMLSLGLDYRQFTKFNLYTPTFEHTFEGRKIKRQRPDPTHAECRFCIDFIINSALELQEAEYTLPT